MRVVLDLDTDQVSQIMVTELIWFHQNGELDDRDIECIEGVLKLYMTEREFNDFMGVEVGT